MAPLRGGVDVIKYWCQVPAFLNSTILVDTREPASIYSLLSALAYREPPRPASHGRWVLLSLVLSFSYRERCDCWGIQGNIAYGLSSQMFKSTQPATSYDL